MATRVTTITNISNQTIPILVNPIALDKAAAASDIEPTRAESMQIPPGSQVEIETQRIDLGQLEQLQRAKVITFVGY
jgi:hypothetical protein